MTGGYLTGLMSDSEKLEHWRAMLRFWESVKRSYNSYQSKIQVSYYKAMIVRGEVID